MGSEKDFLCAKQWPSSIFCNITDQFVCLLFSVAVNLFWMNVLQMMYRSSFHIMMFCFSLKSCYVCIMTSLIHMA